MGQLLDKYIINNTYPKDVNPKVVRTIIWRTLCNTTKSKEGEAYVRNNISSIVLAAIEVLTANKSDSSLVVACVMSFNNILFIEDLDFTEIPKPDMYRVLSGNLSSDVDNTVIALLNIFCRLISKDKEFQNYIKKDVYSDFKVKIDTLKYHREKTVQLLVDDALLLLG